MNRIRLIFILALALLVASCTHKELCYDHSHVVDVNVEFEWDETIDTYPASISVYFFPEDGNEPLRYEFTNPDGGRIRMEHGAYKAICLNSDTRNVAIRDRSNFNTFSISTKDATSMYGLSTFGITTSNLPKSTKVDNERYALSPELVYTDCVTDINISILDSEPTVRFTPKLITRNYTFEVLDAPNLKWVHGVSGTISSLSDGFCPSSGKLSKDCVTIPFNSYMNQSEGTLSGSFTAYGCCPDIQQHHKFIIYAVLSDNSQWYYTYDITEQVHNAPDPFNTHIVLDHIPIPKPVANGGGFKPSIGEWNSIEIEIQM